jgi:RNA polymerase sigma-70 factor (ECF subfamily)
MRGDANRTFGRLGQYHLWMGMRGGKLTLVPPLSEGGEAPVDERSDDELMLLARGGVASAFETLVRRHQTRALRVAARRLGRGAPVADVVQSTFLEVYRSLGRYQARGRFSSYLYRVLLNQCAMVRRSAGVETRAALVMPAVPAETAATQEAAILARERERDVEAALGRLSGKLRDVVVLRYSGALQYDEIADVLQIPVGTVKRRLFDALE